MPWKDSMDGSMNGVRVLMLCSQHGGGSVERSSP